MGVSWAPKKGDGFLARGVGSFDRTPCECVMAISRFDETR